MKMAALNTGPEFHGLDHIAPLAAVLGIPLIVTDERSFALAKRFYPQVTFRYMPDLDQDLSGLAEEFDALFECKYWAPNLKELFQKLYGKEMRLIFCPHGQSDKGFKAPLLAPYGFQDRVLLYGELFIEMLKNLHIWPHISRYALVGNYRFSFYRKHRPFYDGLADLAAPIDKKKKTLLYAPTWKDADGATSFFQYGKRLIEELPSDWNLIVKVHPLLEERDPAHFYAIAAHVDKKPNAFLIGAFPPVYPLLSLSDLYLGDASSVGYDFLLFERPLYFFPTEHPGRLHSIGKTLELDKNFYSQMDTPFNEEGKKLYAHAFGSEIEEDVLRSRIKRLVSL
jgi:hypothetical protein